MSKQHSHLVIIQGVVDRLSQNSFLLKGWSVVLVSSLFALAAKDADLSFVLLAYFPSLAFWLLDGYFLWQERLFRNLYDHVRMLADRDVDFSMKTGDAPHANEVTWWAAVFSRTILWFHGIVFSSVVSVMLIMTWKS